MDAWPVSLQLVEFHLKDRSPPVKNGPAGSAHRIKMVGPFAHEKKQKFLFEKIDRISKIILLFSHNSPWWIC